MERVSYLPCTIEFDGKIDEKKFNVVDGDNGKKAAYFRGRRLEGHTLCLHDMVVFKADVKSKSKVKVIDDIEGIEEEIEKENTFENVKEIKEVILYSEVGDRAANAEFHNIHNILNIAEAFHSD